MRPEDLEDLAILEAYEIILVTMFRVHAQDWKTAKNSSCDRETLNVLAAEGETLYRKIRSVRATITELLERLESL